MAAPPRMSAVRTGQICGKIPRLCAVLGNWCVFFFFHRMSSCFVFCGCGFRVFRIFVFFFQGFLEFQVFLELIVKLFFDEVNGRFY